MADRCPTCGWGEGEDLSDLTVHRPGCSAITSTRTLSLDDDGRLHAER